MVQSQDVQYREKDMLFTGTNSYTIMMGRLGWNVASTVRGYSHMEWHFKRGCEKLTLSFLSMMKEDFVDDPQQVGWAVIFTVGECTMHFTYKKEDWA